MRKRTSPLVQSESGSLRGARHIACTPRTRPLLGGTPVAIGLWGFVRRRAGWGASGLQIASTGTGARVVPVATLDGSPLGDPRERPVMDRLIECFEAFTVERGTAF